MPGLAFFATGQIRDHLRQHIQNIPYHESAGQEYGNDTGSCHPLWVMIIGSHDFFFPGSSQADNENQRNNKPVQCAGQNQKFCRLSDHRHQECTQTYEDAGDEFFMLFQPWM